jgi:hypothetical protein
VNLSPEEATSLLLDCHPDFEEVYRSGDWEGDKYQYLDVVARHIPTGKHYGASFCRSGSYYTEWWYDHDDNGITLAEVVKKEVVTEKWVPA